MKTIGHPGDSHHCSRGCYKTLLELRSPGTEWQSSHHLILGRLAFRWPIPLIPLFPLYWSRALCGSFWGRVFFFPFELITFIAQELQSSLKFCFYLTPRHRQSFVKEPLRVCGMPGRGWLMECKWLAPGQDEVLDYCC